MQLQNVNPRNPFTIALVIVLLLALTFFIARWTKREKDDSEQIIEGENELRKTYGSELEEVDLSPQKLMQDAITLKRAFGWGMALFGLDAPIEREDIIIAVIRRYTFEQYPYLAGAYNKVTARNLTADVNRYLNSREIDQIADIIKS